MMRKIIKNISVFFLWLACLVIIAHVIVPHDHHLADSFTTKEDSCPVSNGKTGHSSGFPIHCHAFNDLTSEKATIYFFTCNIQYNDIVISSFFYPFAFELQFHYIPIIDLRESFPDPYLLELSQFRAPPLLS
ncbi:MAG: hypothetical protein Q7T72_08120 [Bacteroidales bacterium]|nr:hypothetical protein [Bacteroidales bacterium]MDP3003178.1 hypothetical protein [Bacteroidales bacterium]